MEGGHPPSVKRLDTIVQKPPSHLLQKFRLNCHSFKLSADISKSSAPPLSELKRAFLNDRYHRVRLFYRGRVSTLHDTDVLVSN